MPRVPPWRWTIWGPWPPEGTGPTQDEIRKRAHILATLDSSRSADENWIKAEKELTEPLPWSSFVRWLGFNEKKGWDWLDFLCRFSFPAIIAFGGWYLSSQATIRQQKISNYQRDFNVTSEYMKAVQSLLLNNELNTRVLGPTERRLLRNLTLSALKQVYDPGNRTLIARFLLCGSDVEPINITPPISWSSANLQNTDLKGCKLANTDFRWAYLQGADLKGSDLSNADIRYADLTAVDLRGSSSILSNAKLSLAYLRYSDLRGANLKGANLYHAKMEWANLSGADLTDADLSMADLSRADLRFTRFVRANLGSTQRPPGPKNQSGAILRDAHLEGAFLQTADLRDADLTGAHLAGADLRRAELSGANFSRVTWNESTQWPNLSTMKQAKNIPPLLKEQLGI